ncbi:hypothetical protein M5K25_002385 [Dendrobium thyrsiflorum]|uniref:Uncharacterized protein n=1 Tax=Dendrobium thyrsiflorum TaxID=117978 RepID=A0ABD0VM98_DENTH
MEAGLRAKGRIERGIESFLYGGKRSKRVVKAFGRCRLVVGASSSSSTNSDKRPDNIIIISRISFRRLLNIRIILNLQIVTKLLTQPNIQLEMIREYTAAVILLILESEHIIHNRVKNVARRFHRPQSPTILLVSASSHFFSSIRGTEEDAFSSTLKSLRLIITSEYQLRLGFGVPFKSSCCQATNELSEEQSVIPYCVFTGGFELRQALPGIVSTIEGTGDLFQLVSPPDQWYDSLDLLRDYSLKLYSSHRLEGTSYIWWSGLASNVLSFIIMLRSASYSRDLKHLISVFSPHLSPYLSSHIGECGVFIIKEILLNFFYLFSWGAITSTNGGTNLALASVYSPSWWLSIFVIFTFIILSFIIDVGVPQHVDDFHYPDLRAAAPLDLRFLIQQEDFFDLWAAVEVD